MLRRQSRGLGLNGFGEGGVWQPILHVLHVPARVIIHRRPGGEIRGVIAIYPKGCEDTPVKLLVSPRHCPRLGRSVTASPLPDPPKSPVSTAEWKPPHRAGHPMGSRPPDSMPDGVTATQLNTELCGPAAWRVSGLAPPLECRFAS